MLELRSHEGAPLIAMSRRAWAALSEGQRKRIAAYAQPLLAPIETIERLGGGSARCMLAEIFLPQRVALPHNDATTDAQSESRSLCLP
jgi:hypothetical protein